MRIDKIQEFIRLTKAQVEPEKDILRLSNVTKCFSQTSGVKNISFQVKQGEFVALVGEHEAGKTTIIKCLLGDYVLNDGVITFGGEQIQQLKRMKEIAFFPDKNNFHRFSRVTTYAYACASLKGVKRSVLKPKMKNYLLALGLQDAAHKKIRKLSLGMQKRVLLLSALVSSPKMIVLDNPIHDLTFNERTEFINVLAYLNQNFQTTILIATENIDEFHDLVNHQVLLQNLGGFGTMVTDETFDYQN